MTDPATPTPESAPVGPGQPGNFARLFFVPALIAASLLLVYFLVQVGFGRIGSGKGTSARDCLNVIRTGSDRAKIQAATELAAALGREKETLRSDEAFRQELLHLFADRDHLQPEVRSALAYCLVPLWSDDAATALEAAAADAQEALPVRIHATVVLGNENVRHAAPAILANASHEDAYLRAVSAAALGQLQDPAGLPRLREMVHDQAPEVRWAAAAALARFHDEGGVEVLLSMLDAASYAEFRGMDKENIEENMLNAVRALCLIRDVPAAAAALAKASTDGALTPAVRAAASACAAP